MILIIIIAEVPEAMGVRPLSPPSAGSRLLRTNSGKRSVSSAAPAVSLRPYHPDTYWAGMRLTTMSMQMVFLLLWGEASWAWVPWRGRAGRGRNVDLTGMSPQVSP